MSEDWKTPENTPWDDFAPDDTPEWRGEEHPEALPPSRKCWRCWWDDDGNEHHSDPPLGWTLPQPGVSAMSFWWGDDT